MQLLSDAMEQVHTVKYIEPTTKNINQIHPIRHYFRSIRLKPHATKQILQNLKSPIQSCLIQRIF